MTELNTHGEHHEDGADPRRISMRESARSIIETTKLVSQRQLVHIEVVCLPKHEEDVEEEGRNFRGRESAGSVQDNADS